MGYSARGGSGYNTKNRRSTNSTSRKKKGTTYSEHIKQMRHERFLEDAEYDVNPNMTVEQAIKHHFNTYIIEFGNERWFRFPEWSSETYKTDPYGHFEVDVTSFLAAEAGVDEDTKLVDAETMIRTYLLKHEVGSEE